MTDRPIIFSAAMVRALLNGRKSQTRRVLKPLPRRTVFFDPKTAGLGQFQEPPYAPGDRLYVREAFSYETLDVDRNGFMPPWYWADGNPASGDFTRPKPSIHMPRWASRITLTVTEVRVQRLQEISEADAKAEGAGLTPEDIADNERLRGAVLLPHIDAIYGDKRPYRTAVGNFASLWNSLHGPDAWGANPWVVAVSFSVRQRNIDAA